MKNIFIALILMSLTTVVKAEKWLVISTRGGTIKVFWMDNQPFPGEGIITLGPFPDRNAPTIVDGAGQVMPVKIGEIPPPTKTTNLTDLSTQTAVLVYEKDNKIQMVALADATDWKALLQYFQSEKGKSGKCQIFWTTATRGNTFTINDKAVPLNSKPATCPRGDILIGGEPIGIE